MRNLIALAFEVLYGIGWGIYAIYQRLTCDHPFWATKVREDGMMVSSCWYCGVSVELTWKEFVDAVLKE